MRHAKKVLAASMFVMGACGLIYEYTLGALGNNLIGSSHEQLYVVIGLMLSAMGLGAYLQKSIGSEKLIDKFLLLELFLGIVGGISATVIYATFSYTTSYKLVLWIFAIVIGCFIGMEIPILLRINKEYSKDLKTNLSEILAMDYVGSLAGALLFAYVLITNISIEKIAIILGIVNIMTAMFGLFYFWKIVKNKAIITSFCAACLVALIGLSTISSDLINTFEQRVFRDPIIYSGTSKYQHIVMTKRGDNLNFFINGHLQFSSSDEAIYHEMLVHPAMSIADNRSDVLILGGGDGLALREVFKYADVKSVTLVDLDPFITELASTNPDLIRLNRNSLSDPRADIKIASGVYSGPEEQIVKRSKTYKRKYRLAKINVINLDADIFLRSASSLYDIVIIDFPDPRSLELSKLYSVEFYKSLGQHLRPESLITIQSSSPYHARKIFLSIRKTLKTAGYKVIPYRQNVPSFGEWGWNMAWIGPTSEGEMRQKLFGTRLDVVTSYVSPEIISSAAIFPKGWLDDEGIRVNTKMRPVMPKYHRQSWKN